ncbi:glutathione ABC transporter substrate-binding protein GsiB [Pseudomonas sp. FW306-02-F02-AA]|uniref:Diguanylate cyclase n=1 Tax=Pseudomonas fluorescens TaxID=294 RepID=A0A0N9VYA1_PSEFL|nr:MULTISPECIES: ABC transporter substrate-binding protein [Pseudomonas]PMZ08120.1 glutathione ABC transporter substrate-binding protein GsiB [Pseudomonas sp. FW306-02-H06C]PMZ32586.1 glutathione ABC transporter substrate-binding protein GsiB [Pseudomonas sp. FW306-02-H06B]ALI03582.1 diguanylate cyclase [Pseudomonas fluorescens]PMZ02109.1 glutathione ABC transporter substrate-binding protein GsiB [Pseudomonas sp. FW306-02-F02-AB]PMZ14660.1 glutathione ABC transporter substrate-binding protein 
MKSKHLKLLTAATLAACTLAAGVSQAAGVLTIGCREESTTFDPIKSAQNRDNWVFSNVYDVLVRVDNAGTKLVPGLAESWKISDDGLIYTFKLRSAKFSDGSPITASDAVFSLLRIRDNKGSLWSDSYKIIDKAEAIDPQTLVVTLKTPSVPFLSQLALPNVSILSQKAMEKMGEEAYAQEPVASGAFTVKEWLRGDRVVLEKNPNFWQADKVSLDGVEWISIPDDNTRMLKVQAGELDSAIFVPFSRVETLKKDSNLVVHMNPSTREDHLLINHEHGLLAKPEVRQALDLAINKKSLVDTVTFGHGQVAYSYIPKGALYHNADNLQRPYNPEKAKKMLADAGASRLKLNYVVNAGNEADEQIAVLVQQQLAAAGVTVTLQKVDPTQSWQMLIDGDYDLSVMYWTNDILDPDQKTTFVLGHDTNMNYMTRYKNDKVKDLVATARVEVDPSKRKQMYTDLQTMAKQDVNWIDLYYSPYINVSRKNIEHFQQNPLGRFSLEETVKN